MLREHEVAVQSLSAAADTVEPGHVRVTTAPLGRGFAHEGARLEVVTETDLTGQPGSGTSTKDMRRMPSRRRNQVDPLQLRPGDFVVHEQHGVGRFVEMMQRTVAGATREYLVIEYAPSKRGQPGDRLFVPTDQLDQVTKYVGGEEPTLNKMGGSDWTKTKSRAKRYVKQIAADLIRLYSARQATKGHAFAPDTPWQRELEDAFGYVETPDQLVSIDEVKADMEKQVPMDRLICGDVGYGKTEIAVRAAFKAIQDGKQVAVLVPTTLLVSQHQQTFAERYAQFPVKVASLSRFQSDKEAKEVMAGMADGTIDLVIGTHRLLAKDVTFKDLGLVVIDEEQRFGVEHKELLKTMRTAVDVLSMSATPDPAHARDGGDRHPRDVDPRHAARGAPPGAHLRRCLRREADHRGHPPRAAARGPGLLRAQQGEQHREGGRAPARARARGAHRDRPRPDGRAQARGRSSRTSGRSASTCSSARRSSRPASTSPTPTPSSSSAPTCSASRSCTSCAAASAAGASGPTPTSSTRPRSR